MVEVTVDDIKLGVDPEVLGEAVKIGVDGGREGVIKAFVDEH